METITATDYNHSPGRARRIADDIGPVAITDRGTPTHVVVTYDEWVRLSEKPFVSLADAMRMDGYDQVAGDEFDRILEENRAAHRAITPTVPDFVS